MSAALMAFAKWLQGTGWATWISGSTWAYPFVQLTHFFGLSLWIGTNLALDFRLLGLGRKRLTGADLSRNLFAWNWAGFAIAVCGGFMLFSASATKYVINPAFLIKVGILVPCALIVHIIVQQNAKIWGATADTLRIGKYMGLVEIILWIGVVTAAVSIPTFEIFGS